MTCQFRGPHFKHLAFPPGNFSFLFSRRKDVPNRALLKPMEESAKSLFRELLFMNFVVYSCSLVFEDVSCRNMALSRTRRRIDLGGSEDFMNDCNAFSFIYLCQPLLLKFWP